MKVLQLCHKPPFPSKDGGCVAIRSLSEGLLAKGHDLRILSIETHKHPFIPEEFPEGLLEKTGFRSVFVDTKLDVIEAFSNLVNRDPYNVSRFFSPDLDLALTDILQEEDFDVVQVESLFMTPYLDTIRRFSNARIVLRSHNLEHQIWEKVAKDTKNFMKKFYLNILAEQLKKHELEVLDKVDGVVTISTEDTKKFENLGCSVPIVTIPFGVDTSKVKPNGVTQEKKGEIPIFHLGSMDWVPNQTGVEWLLKKVWPRIKEELPETKLYLAGRNMPEEFRDRSIPGVEFVGEVEDAHEFMEAGSVMLVPLLAGSGIRVKIIEGMALQKAIVSTPTGAEGIDHSHKENILIGSTPEEFAKMTIQLVRDTHLQEELGKNARRLVEESYDEDRIIDRLMGFYNTLLEK